MIYCVLYIFNYNQVFMIKALWGLAFSHDIAVPPAVGCLQSNLLYG